MAIRIELDKATVERAINMAIASAKRGKGKQSPAFDAVLEQDISLLAKALNTLTEIK